jgi:hypothetical protein
MKESSTWSSLANKCVLDNFSQTRYNITITAVTDVTQLAIIMAGLLRSRQEKHGLLRYLYIQVGVVFYVLLLTMTMLKLN